MADILCRQSAATDMASAFVSYNMAIRDSIGLCLQEQMSVDLAATVSVCMTNHKDVSLQFRAFTVD